MTIIGTPQRDEEQVAEVPEPEPSSEPEPEPEPDLLPAAKADQGPGRSKRRWRRRAEPESDDQPEPPRHVRVLPADEDGDRRDPWEEGFDAAAYGVEEVEAEPRR
jgi:hypothetical protein